MDIRQHIQNAARRLADAGIATARLDAEVLLAHVLETTRERLYLDAGLSLAGDRAATFEALIARRAGGEPVAYITGLREFWSLPIAVSPATLIPRPDSETLIAAVCETVAARPGLQGRGLSILDLGTGSGCLLLALLSELDGARGLGVDREGAAVAVAAANARALDLDGRAAFVVSDWDGALGPDQQFDIIVSNPPYIPTAAIAELERDVRAFEPVTALDGGTDGLDAYRRLFPIATRRLAPGGLTAFEIGAGQDKAVSALADTAGLSLCESMQDLAGCERVLIFKGKADCQRKTVGNFRRPG